VTPEFSDAFALLEHTRTNVFLTGKAGTGKSTFLQYFRQHTKKKIAVVAPTGVAALNVGGQTIHSFFRLKPTLIDVTTLKPIRNKVLKALQLLIIDEISMVRADVFDGIDHSLRIARRSNESFGGVQLCVIGDLFQLPPVITHHESELFSQRYRSPFFFCTQAYEDAEFKRVEFSHIHRQNDAEFIGILNAIRNGVCQEPELHTLNNRHIAKATPAPGTLVLTATNALAESINNTKLAALSGRLRTYTGVTSGNFGLQDTRLPAAESLRLKEGAQVMFVKNDSGGRWVNGTIGIVETLEDEHITVRVGEFSYDVKPEKWKNLSYELSETTNKIVEKTLGSYTQFPLALAWGITIHKAQGKTLDRVIIDLGHGAFAAGQLYVALSRCKTLSGIALKQPVSPKDIQCDPEVVEFMQRPI
jgi:ATP-dependent exoDNAse (exonuclease V) alpha subunit